MQLRDYLRATDAKLVGLTIEQGIYLFALVCAVCMLLFIWLGYHRIRSARQLPYYILKRKQIGAGWKVILVGIAFALCTVLIMAYGQRMVFVFIEPTPSVTPTASRTLTPTISSTPSETQTPRSTNTATISPIPSLTFTPMIPEAITVLFNETVTPDARAVFSPIELSRRLDSQNRPVNPAEEFGNPIDTLFGAFTYDFMSDGARWTAIWYRGEDVVCVESKPWDGGTGGYGYTECRPRGLWQAGEYEIQIFLAEEWKVSTRFSVSGIPNTSTQLPSRTPKTGDP